MLKFNYAINLALATLLVVPAVTLGTSQNEPLEQTLRRTMRALEQLAGIEQRLQEHDASAISAALAATEPSLPTPADRPDARDELLVALRADVARLQGEAELLENGVGATAELHTPAPPPAEPVVSSDGTAAEAPATLGLDDAARRLLAARAAVGSSAPSAPSATVSQPTTTNAEGKRAFEPEGYAADALKLGRAYYRQGQFAQALATFEARRDDPDAAYWRARCLEKLGRGADALAAYSGVIANPKAGAIGERAKEDFDFLQWRLEFEGARGGKGAKQP